MAVACGDGKWKVDLGLELLLGGFRAEWCLE